jgi:SAM-dependent methyltransferase
MRIGRPLSRLQRRLLQRLYGFDTWHVGHANETYVADIVRHLNARRVASRGAAVEIGCGTGDILRRLRFATRLGLDADARVLRAARVLSIAGRGPRPRFEVFRFPGAALSGSYDAIIMVNWIHLIAPAILRPALASYFNAHLQPGGELVVDTIADPAYTYNHDVHILAPRSATIHHLGRYHRNRDVWALEKS